MPVKKQTLTTPKTLAHDKEDLIRATTPKWRHTWSNEDPHDVADAQKQIERTHDACKQQDMQLFKQGTSYACEMASDETFVVAVDLIATLFSGSA